MSALADTRPPGVDHWFRPGGTVRVTIEWDDDDSLAGRTFTSTLDDVALAVDVEGQTITVEATAAQTGVHEDGTTVEWLLLEDIDGTDEAVMVGRWGASLQAADSATSTVAVAAGAVTVPVTVTSAQASTVALAGRVDDLEAPDVAVVDWAVPGAWDRFTESVVTVEATHVYTLGVDDGQGVIDGSAGTGGDRKILVLAGFTAADVEVRLDYAMSAGSVQPGIAIRVDGTDAVACNSNVVFGAVGQINVAHWDWAAGLVNNLVGTFSDRRAILSYDGDGTEIIFELAEPHSVVVGDQINLDVGGDIPAHPTITATPSASSFVIADDTVVSGTGTTYAETFRARRRSLAVRAQGDVIRVKQWSAGQPEPSWADPVRCFTGTLPAGSPSAGAVGVIANHVGSGSITVGNLVAHRL